METNTMHSSLSTKTLHDLVHALNNNGTSSRSKKKNSRQRRQKRNKSNVKKINEGGDHDNTLLENNCPSKQPLQHDDVEVEYVVEKTTDVIGHDVLEGFENVFAKFDVSFSFAGGDDNLNNQKKKDETCKDVQSTSDEEEGEEDVNHKKEKPQLSNKQRKLQQRMKIAELKQFCKRPDVVEVWDAAAPDPKLLVSLKSYRNTIPVPSHWCSKRKYLQGKRGVEKPRFELPDYIAATDIEKLRQVYVDKSENMKLKQKQRQRMRPKMPKMDIDTEVLYDAFFKYQTKPKMTSYGDLYYEGKEFEVKFKKAVKPGVLSQELKEALGMAEGAPPPWLLSMQRHGLPPSYPHLKVPGLNIHPIPVETNYEDEPVDRSKHWGDYEEEELEEEVEEQEVAAEEEVDGGSRASESDASEVETSDSVIELRKEQKNKEPERPLYEVLEKKEEKIAPGTLLGTTHTYVIGNAAASKRVGLLRGKSSDQVEITIEPDKLDELENEDNGVATMYEKAKELEKHRNKREDFSDMVAKNERKRKRKQEKDGKAKKKEFKF